MKELLTPERIAWLSGIVVFIISAVVDHLSSNFKPWSWVLRKFGAALNAELTEKIEEVKNLEVTDQAHDIARIEALEQAQEKFFLRYDEDDARSARRRILRFADELRANVDHSMEFFVDILDDVSFYNNYCEQHPEFKNRRTDVATKLIEETYEQCMKKNNFL